MKFGESFLTARLLRNAITSMLSALACLIAHMVLPSAQETGNPWLHSMVEQGLLYVGYVCATLGVIWSVAHFLVAPARQDGV